MEKITSLAYNNKRLASIDYLYSKNKTDSKWRETKLDFNFVIKNDNTSVSDLQAVKNDVEFPKFNTFKEAFLSDRFFNCDIKKFSQLKKDYKETETIDNGEKVLYKKSGYKNIDASWQYLYIQDVEKFINKANRFNILGYLNSLEDLKEFDILNVRLFTLDLIGDTYQITDMSADMKKYIGVTITNKKASNLLANQEKEKAILHKKEKTEQNKVA